MVSLHVVIAVMGYEPDGSHPSERGLGTRRWNRVSLALRMRVPSLLTPSCYLVNILHDQNATAFMIVEHGMAQED
jgi:hypothetical protein